MNNWSAARRISARVGLVAGLLLMSMAPAGAQERAYSKWFRYGEGIDTAWEITGDAAKPLQALIRRKGWEHRTSPRRVLVLYPRPSSAYDVAITKILHVFESKELNSEFVAINFEMNDTRGKDAIQFAEDNKFDLI